MLSRIMARSLMAIVPEKGSVVLTLAPNPLPTATRLTEVLTIYGCWEKPIKGSLSEYGHLNLQGDETLILIPALGLNPTNNGRDIRAEDEIVWQGTTYVVVGQGSTLKTVQTVFACVCRYKIA